MAITKAQKDTILEGYMETLKGAQGMIVTQYRGMGMKSLNAIRGVVRPIKGQYTVTKNTLFKIALRESGFAAPDDMLTGPTAVAIAYQDLAALTKAMMQRAKEDELLILRGVIMGLNVFGADQLEAVSTMPTLAEARAGLIGTLQQPASKFVGLIVQPAQGLAAILKAYTDDKTPPAETESAEAA